MHIYSLETENFRLLAPQRIDFQPGVNVIVGANAQGKTTVLEAAYLLTGARSFRTRFDKEIIRFQQDSALLSGEINACGRDQSVELRLFRGRQRQLVCNGVRRRSSEMTENLTAVLFCPDDLMLIKGGAAGRRKMLDMAISQLRPGYRALIADYNRIFENKTRILRDWREKPALLDTLDDFSLSLCRYTAKIIRYRASFSRRLSRLAGEIHKEFSGGGEELTASYATVSTVTDTQAAESVLFEQVMQRQRELRQAELDAGLCLVGAHKDELLMYINGVEARTFASQGQTRTAALSLKIAERDIFLQETGEIPVLLLDDVLSELDGERQEFVLNRIRGGQTLITCCDEESISRLTGGRVLRLEGGCVS